MHVTQDYFIVMIYAVILGTATSVVLLKCIGRLHPVVYYLKCTGHGVWIFLLSIVCLPYFIVRKKGPDYAWFALNPYAAYGRHVMGQRFEFTLPLKEVRKRLPPGGIIVANHQSSIDAFGVVEIWRAVGRMSIVVKKVFKYFGMLGLIGYLTGMLFIDRRKSSEALSSLSVAAIQCQETGTRIIMFPEGTRHHQKGVKRMLPFKKGAFVAAVDSGVCVHS